MMEAQMLVRHYRGEISPICYGKLAEMLRCAVESKVLFFKFFLI
jgi:hypothetical protein